MRPNPSAWKQVGTANSQYRTPQLASEDREIRAAAIRSESEGCAWSASLAGG